MNFKLGDIVRFETHWDSIYVFRNRGLSNQYDRILYHNLSKNNILVY